MKIVLLATVAGLALCAPAANAAVNIYVSNTNAGVFAQVLGSLDLTGLAHAPQATSSVSVRGTAFFFTGVGGVTVNAYGGLTGPEFGDTLFSYASSGGGIPFGFNLVNGRVFLPTDYVSGSAINSSATYAYKTLQDLELYVGTYVYTVGSDHITLHIGEAAPAVPEPASWALMLGGFGAIGAALRSRRKVAVRFG